MKKQNPSKKLTLVKKTIAHLNKEQMGSAHGGTDHWRTKVACTDSFTPTQISCY